MTWHLQMASGKGQLLNELKKKKKSLSALISHYLNSCLPFPPQYQLLEGKVLILL